MKRINYTVMLTWSTTTPTGRLKQNHKTLKNIIANNAQEARVIALSKIPKNCTGQVNCLWYN